MREETASVTILSGSFTGKGKDRLGLKMEKNLGIKGQYFLDGKYLNAKYFNTYDTVKY